MRHPHPCGRRSQISLASDSKGTNPPVPLASGVPPASEFKFPPSVRRSDHRSFRMKTQASENLIFLDSCKCLFYLDNPAPPPDSSSAGGEESSVRESYCSALDHQCQGNSFSSSEHITSLRKIRKISQQEHKPLRSSEHITSIRQSISKSPTRSILEFDRSSHPQPLPQRKQPNSGETSASARSGRLCRLPDSD